MPENTALLDEISALKSALKTTERERNHFRDTLSALINKKPMAWLIHGPDEVIFDEAKAESAAEAGLPVTKLAIHPSEESFPIADNAEKKES